MLGFTPDLFYEPSELNLADRKIKKMAYHQDESYVRTSLIGVLNQYPCQEISEIISLLQKKHPCGEDAEYNLEYKSDENDSSDEILKNILVYLLGFKISLHFSTDSTKIQVSVREAQRSKRFVATCNITKEGEEVSENIFMLLAYISKALDSRTVLNSLSIERVEKKEDY